MLGQVNLQLSVCFEILDFHQRCTFFGVVVDLLVFFTLIPVRIYFQQNIFTWTHGLKNTRFTAHFAFHSHFRCLPAVRAQNVGTHAHALLQIILVPQGSVLGPLLFLAYTIDLPNCVRHPTQCDQFADDTALTTVSSSPGVCEEHLQQSVTATSTWLSNWRLTVNVEKTVTMAFTRRPFPSKVSINLNGNALSTVSEHRHLGLILSSDLRWSAHIDKILSKAGRLLYTIIRLRRTLSRKALILYYSLYIRPVVEYACIAWPKLSAHLRNRLERFQRRAFKVILRKPLFEPSDHDEVLLTLQQPSLESRRQYQSAILGFQLANKTAPQHLLNELMLPPCKSSPLPPPT